MIWDQARHGKDVQYCLSLDLEESSDSAAEIARVIGLIIDSCSSETTKGQAIFKECRRMEQEIDENYSRLEEYALANLGRDTDASIKMAELLATKCEKLSELQSKLIGD